MSEKMEYSQFGYTEKQVWVLEKVDELALELGKDNQPSYNQACIKIGIGAGTVSDLRKGKYKGLKDKQFNRLIEYFDVKTENAKVYKDNGYLPTSVSTQVYNYLRCCQIKGRLMAISGDAGIGKTQAIRKYMEDNYATSVKVTADDDTSTLSPFKKALCKELGIISTGKYEMSEDIRRKLKDGMIIIVDEAQNLHMKTINYLRQLSDYFEENGMTLGIAFVGNETTINKFGMNANANFAQIDNRTLQKPIFSTKDILKEDIELLFPDIAEKKMAVDFMLVVARSRQGIRGAKNLFSEAYDNNNITYDGLVAMAKKMGLDL